MASRVAKANARVQKKLRKAIDAGDLYSAQQMYMTLYHRSVRTNDSATAVSTIKDGVATMTEHAEWGCARELALLLIEVLKKNERILDDAAADDITAVFGYFAAAGEAESTAAGYDYMREAIAWAEKHSDEDDDGQGALLMRLHDDLATALRASGNFADAARHYTQGCRIGEFAEMLVAWAQQGSAGEQDLFLVRAVLQLLAWSRDDAAAVLIPRFAKEWENATQSALETTPLVNFINLLLEAIDLGAPELFEELRTSYSVALARDPSFGDYLTIVADIYFGIRPPPKGGLFANLISSMMGGGDNGGSSKGRGRRRIGGGGGGGSGSGAAAPPAPVVQEDVD